MTPTSVAAVMVLMVAPNHEGWVRAHCPAAEWREVWEAFIRWQSDRDIDIDIT